MQVAVIDAADDLCLIRIHPRISLAVQVVPIELTEVNGSFTLLHRLPFSPPDIRTDGFTFRLGKGAHEGDDQFRVHFQCVDILFLEDNPNPQFLQRPDILQAVQRVSGKAGHGLCQDQIDFLLAASADHAVEIITSLGGSACDALIGKNPSHGPLGIRHDLICVIGAFGFVAGLLFFLLCGNPAVGSYPKLPPDSLLTSLRLCRDHRYSPLEIVQFIHPFP